MTRPDFEALLTQDQWLRRLARQLVGDPHLAEDVAQETWLAGLARPEGGSASRAWFSAVARNMTRRTIRSRVRERDRMGRIRQEEVEMAPATDDLVEQLQLRERVWRALQELQEPFRTTLYLRYVEDLGTVAISRRMDVAPSTVTQRTQIGVERLRRALDANYGGERGTWSLLLAPYARGLTAPSWAIAGGSATIVLVLGLVFTAGTLGLIMALTTSAEDPPPSWVAAPKQGESPASESLAQLQPSLSEPKHRVMVAADEQPRLSERRDGQGTSSASPQEARLLGQFQLPDGAPAVGALWSLRGSRGDRQRVLDHGLPDEWHNLTGQLDAQGRFSANFDPPPAYQFSFQVMAPDTVSALWRWHHLDPGEERDLGSVRLERSCTLEGLVLNDDGEAATRRQWTVSARSPETASNDGREPIASSATTTQGTSAYRLEGLPAGPVEVTVWERQYGRTRPVVTRLTLDQENSLNLTVPGIEEADRRVTLYARVASYSSSVLPALDAIRLQAEDGHEQVARERGNNQLGFRFDRVGPGAHRLIVDDPRFERHVMEGVHRGDRLSVQLRGSAALVFDWKTEGEQGTPDDYSVEVRYENVSFFPRNFRPHQGGRLKDDVLTGMVPGDYSIVVRAGEFLGFALVPDLKPGERRRVAMSLQPPNEVRGRVLRMDGSPVVDALVRLIRPAELEDAPDTTILGPNSMSSHPERMRHEVDRCQTDAEGSFVFRPERHGSFLVVAGSDGGLRTESPVFRLGEKTRVEDFELVLARSASLGGRVVGLEGLDLSGWAVAYIQEDDPLSFQRTRQPLGPGGEFEWSEIRPGEVSLYLLRPQEWPGLHADLSPSNGKRLGEWALTSGQVVTAELECPGELPAHVTWDRLGGAANYLAEEAWILEQNSKVALPLAMGSKRIGPAWLDEGQYRLYLTGDRWLYRAEKLLQVHQSAALEGAREDNMISGRIRLLHGDQPLVEAIVSLLFADLEGVMGPLTSFETDQDGWFDLTASPGTLRIWIRAKEHPGARLDPIRWPLTGEDRTLRVR